MHALYRAAELREGRAQKVDLGDGKTGVAITFTLLPDARWGDGQPITTEDVAFSYKLGQTPQVGVADAEAYRRVVKVDIKDAKTFTLTLDRITFDYPIAAAVPILPAHLEQRFGRPGAVSLPHALRHRPDQSRPL